MKWQFVTTGNYSRFMEGVARATNARAGRTAIFLVIGENGMGKTSLFKRFQGTEGPIMLTGNSAWSRSYFRDSLANEVGVNPAGRSHAVDAALLGALRKRRRNPILIDEGHFSFARDKHTNDAPIEYLRGTLTDISGNAVILAMPPKYADLVSDHAEVASRLVDRMVVVPASLDDTALFCHQLAEVEIAEDLVARIHKESHGSPYFICNAIEAAELLASRNGKSVVTAADAKGTTLCVSDLLAAGKASAAGKGRK